MEDSRIEAAILEDLVLVRVYGRGSFLNSRLLKDFLERMLNRNYSQFIFDLSNCQTMDSTFMGMLAGIAIKLQKNGNICLVSPNKQCYRLLSTLGLDQILEVRSDFKNPTNEPPVYEKIQGTESYSQKEKIIHAIEAHKNLIKLETQNRVEFDNVLNLLEEDLAKYKDIEPKNNTEKKDEQ